MIDQQLIKPGMPVVDSEGRSVGIVAGVGSDLIELSEAGFGDGLHHVVSLAAVRSVGEDQVVVAPGEASTIEAIEGAVDYGRAHARGRSGGGLFGTSGHGTGFGGSGIGD